MMSIEYQAKLMNLFSWIFSFRKVWTFLSLGAKDFDINSNMNWLKEKWIIRGQIKNNILVFKHNEIIL